MIDLEKVERTAVRVLRSCGIESPPVSVDKVIEHLKLKLVYHDLEDDVSGILVRTREDSFVVVNVKHHENRQRFTIAHECAHYLLHQKEPTVFVDNLLVHFRAAPSSEPDPRESEANRFAAAILMPAAFLQRDLHDRAIDVADDAAVLRLARKYKVSAQALAIRLMTLNLIRGAA